MTRVVEALIERHHPHSRLHLSGSPLVPLPDHVREAVDAAATVPGYAPSGGEPALREAIAASLEARGVRVSPEQVIVTCGAMHALDLVFRSVLQPGDEVLMPAPGFLHRRPGASGGCARGLVPQPGLRPLPALLGGRRSGRHPADQDPVRQHAGKPNRLRLRREGCPRRRGSRGTGRPAARQRRVAVGIRLWRAPRTCRLRPRTRNCAASSWARFPRTTRCLGCALATRSCRRSCSAGCRRCSSGRCWR